MNVQLLFSEKDVRSLLSGQLSENLYAEFIGPAMYEAQEVYLSEFLGSELLHNLKAMLAGGNVTASFDASFGPSFDTDPGLYGPYAELVNEVAKPFLIYKTMTRIIPKVSLKVSNIGVHTTSDEKVAPVSKQLWDTVIEDYDAQASKFLGDMLRWLRDHRDEFTPAERCKMRLGSSTITGIWLGGYVGR